MNLFNEDILRIIIVLLYLQAIFSLTCNPVFNCDLHYDSLGVRIIGEDTASRKFFGNTQYTTDGQEET